jgi:hypothetical protein
LLVCAPVSPGADEKAPADAKAVGGLRLRLQLPAAARGEKVPPQCEVTLENVGDTDLNVKLGFSLANGKSHHPAALRLLVRGKGNKTRTLNYAALPGVVGRVDPFIVPLPAGSRYTLRCKFAKYADSETGDRIDLTAKDYWIAAELLGEAVTNTNLDVRGLALIPCWQGKVRSNEVRLPSARKAKKQDDEDQKVDIINAGETAMELVKTTKDPDAKWMAVRILGSLQYKRAIPLLLESLSDPHHYVRSNAARALGDMRVAAAAKPLTKMLEKESNGGVIQQTSLALGNLRHADAVPALKAAARHKDVQTRMWVLQAIGRLGGKKDVTFLAGYLLNDPSPLVQMMAAQAIEQITGADFGFPKRPGPSGPEAGIERARTWWEKHKGEFKE